MGQLTWQEYYGKEVVNRISLKLIAYFYNSTCHENHRFQNVSKFIPLDTSRDAPRD